MDPEKYLQSILESQKLEEDSAELKELRAHKKEVQEIIEAAYADSNPKIRYGGSYIKGTLIRENYDLDIICYFASNDIKPGDTLEEIYGNVEKVLSEHYYIEQKTSALRLRSKDEAQTSFHIDVVPGRFADGDDGDAYIYQSKGDKGWLKTNLDKHIEYIKGSGHINAIKLAKLWKEKNALTIRTFPLELLVIKLLEGAKKDAPVHEKMLKFWTELKDNSGSIRVEDPANPQGNDLSEIFSAEVLESLRSVAAKTLDTIEQSGWEAVYGETEVATEAEKIAIIRRAAARVPDFPKPHCEI